VRSSRFGEFDLFERLGVGAVGEVFRALRRSDGRVVALKRLSQTASANAEVALMLDEEAEVLAACDHPGIAKLVDRGTTEGRRWIAYEYIHGRDLFAIEERVAPTTRAEGFVVPLDVGIEIALRLAGALAHAHAAGIIHRDVSPANVIVSFDGGVKLLDFGNARAASRITRTGAGEVRGTLGYMSPEQVSGAKLDARTDVYSLGVCLWELAAGRRLFDGGRPMDIMRRIATGKIPAPRDVAPSVPSGVSSVISRSIAHAVDERHASALDFARTLVAAARAEGLVLPDDAALGIGDPRTRSPLVTRDPREGGIGGQAPLEITNQEAAPYAPPSRLARFMRSVFADGLVEVGQNSQDSQPSSARSINMGEKLPPIGHGEDGNLGRGAQAAPSSGRSQQLAASYEAGRVRPVDQLRFSTGSASGPLRGHLERGRHDGLFEESQNMAENKGGSDLDVFEGLAKKSARPAPALGPPPPPSAPPRRGTLIGGLQPLPPPAPPGMPAPSGTPAPPPKPPPPPGALSQPAPPPPLPVEAAAPPPPPTPPAAAVPALPPPAPPPAPPPTTASAPPPPPPVAVSAPPVAPPPVSRGSGFLPAVSAPPKKDESVAARPPTTPLPPPPAPPLKTPLPPPPPIASALPAPLPPPQSIGAQLGMEKSKKAKSAVDMDWDDEEESTHVYDKADGGPTPVGPRPAAGTPAAPRVGAAAALLASSGKAAGAVATPPPPAMPAIPSAPPPPPPIPAVGNNTLPMGLTNEATAVRPRPLPMPPPASVPAPASGSSGRAGVILGGLGLVVALGLAVFMLLPKKGQFRIDVKATGGAPLAHAEIFVDGQKKCDTTPCVVADLEPGPKTIKVISPGFPVSESIESVEAGKERFVSLTLNGDAGSAQQPVASGGGTGLKVAAGQANVKLFVDGADKGALPLELKDLSPGAHKIKFDGGDRYEKLEQSVDVTAGQMRDLGTIKLKVVRGQVTLELSTTGASVELVRLQGTKKVEKKLPDALWKSPPVRVDIDPKEGWQLVATKKGFDDFKQDLAFDDGEAEKTIKIELLEAGKAAPTPPPPGPGPGPAPGPGPGPVKTAEPVNTAKVDTPPPPSGTGTLNINSIPVSKVVLDGKPLGSTPKVGVSVPAGSHTVVFVNPDGVKKTVSVTVKAGETKTAAVKFSAE
jgi:serine/threonine-protein kinase